MQVKLKAQGNGRIRTRWLMLRTRLSVEWTSTNQKPTFYLVTLTSRSYESTRVSGMRYGQASLLNSDAGSRSSMANTAHVALKNTALKDRLRRATIWLMGAISRTLIRPWTFARGRMLIVGKWEMSANGSLLGRLSKSASLVIETCMKFNLSSQTCCLKHFFFFYISLRFKEPLSPFSGKVVQTRKSGGNRAQLTSKVFWHY